MPPRRGWRARFPVQFEALIWELSVYIDGPERLSVWLDVLERMTPAQRETACHDDRRVEDLSLIAADALWIRMHEQSAAEQDWAPIEVALAAMASQGRRLGIEMLWAAAVRGCATVIGEYLKDLDRAVALLRNTIDAMHEPRTLFLLWDVGGRQYLYAGRNTDAQPGSWKQPRGR